jgi:hypothetical protein
MQSRPRGALRVEVTDQDRSTRFREAARRCIADAARSTRNDRPSTLEGNEIGERRFRIGSVHGWFLARGIALRRPRRGRPSNAAQHCRHPWGGLSRKLIKTHGARGSSGGRVTPRLTSFGRTAPLGKREFQRADKARHRSDIVAVGMVADQLPDPNCFEHFAVVVGVSAVAIGVVQQATRRPPPLCGRPGLSDRFPRFRRSCRMPLGLPTRRRRTHGRP